MARSEKDTETETAATVLRVDSQLLLGNNGLASRDVETARTLAPDDPRVLLAAAQVASADGRATEAILILSRAYLVDQHPEIALLYAKALLDRGEASDLVQIRQLIEPIAVVDLPVELRPALIARVIRCLALMQEWAEIDKYLDKSSPFLDDATMTTFRGYVAHHRGVEEEARRFALHARDALTPESSPELIDYLARLMMMVARPSDALPLWQKLFDIEPIGLDPANLLNCAAKLRRDDVILGTCDRLRRQRIRDWKVVEFEIAYRAKYNINDAVERLQGFLSLEPDHWQAKLQLSLFGILLERPDLISARVSDLPTPDQMPLDRAMQAVQVLKLAGDPNEAVRYAYDFLRLHFGEIEAHQALIFTMMPGLSEPEIPSSLESVTADAAVCYRELPNGGDRWLVLEDTTKPLREFEEVPLTSEVACALKGKRIGDEVVLAKGTYQDRTATIVQILPKYVRRFQDSIAEMQVRFGAASSVESVRFEMPTLSDTDAGMQAILTAVKDRAAAVEVVRDFYRDNPVSLHMYGDRFGTNAYSALWDLALGDGVEVKCCAGTSQERAQTVQLLKTARVLVIDLSALATLRILGLEKIVKSDKYKLVVPQRVWLTLREMHSQARVFSTAGGNLRYDGGRHVITERSLDERNEQLRQEKEFISLLEHSAEIRPSTAVAALDPQKRQALEDILGAYGVEAIVLASEPGHALWTDDLAMASVGASEYGVSRVWTQAVMGELLQAGTLSQDEYQDASARLTGFEFVATFFDAYTILAAARMASWKADFFSVKQIIKIFANPVSDITILAGIFARFVQLLFAEPVQRETRCSLAQAFLEAMSSRSTGKTVLSSLRKLSSSLFGLNVLGKKQFEDCFDSWMRYTEGGLIV